ncbi:hypothetical protein FNH43_21610 [Salmonella enterica subsp. salamae]|nr:hypothetical protein [Salmonella enterica subsp. salamae]
MSNSKVSGENGGDGAAVTVAGTVTSSGGGEITGHTENGTAIVVSDGATVTSTQPGGLVLNASATGDGGTGITLGNATVSGHSEQGAGTTVSGHLVSDAASSVSGTSSQGDGLALNGGTLTGGQVSGHSETGSGVVTTGDSRIDGAVLNATSTQGTGLNVQGSLTKTPGTTIGSSSSQGLDNIVTESGTDVGAAAVQIRRQQSATAAVAAHGALPVTTGFTSGATAPVPQQEYREAARPVNLSVCQGGDCRSLQLDADGPQSSDTQRKTHATP